MFVLLFPLSKGYSQINIAKGTTSGIQQLPDSLWRSQRTAHIDDIIEGSVGRAWHQTRKNSRPLHDISPRLGVLILPRPEDTVDGGVVEEESRVTGGSEEILSQPFISLSC